MRRVQPLVSWRHHWAFWCGGAHIREAVGRIPRPRSPRVPRPHHTPAELAALHDAAAALLLRAQEQAAVVDAARSAALGQRHLLAAELASRQEREAAARARVAERHAELARLRAEAEALAAFEAEQRVVIQRALAGAPLAGAAAGGGGGQPPAAV